ncbi:MAG: hypothetical protein GWN17_14410, partial [Candidatus Korarchaeota archaeon]|nr:hypothetical protein [Candidatus Korarchaeota archaeon]
ALKCYGKRGAYYNFRQVTLCTKTSVLWVVVAFALPLLEAFLLILSYSLFIAPLKLASITWFAFLPALIGNFFIAMGEEFG